MDVSVLFSVMNEFIKCLRCGFSIESKLQMAWMALENRVLLSRSKYFAGVYRANGIIYFIQVLWLAVQKLVVVVVQNPLI